MGGRGKGVGGRVQHEGQPAKVECTPDRRRTSLRAPSQRFGEGWSHHGTEADGPPTRGILSQVLPESLCRVGIGVV